jgi:hypothetical protein
VKGMSDFKIPILKRLHSSFFTALPALLLVVMFQISGFPGSEPWWNMFLTVLIFLLGGSLVAGFIFPSLFTRAGIKPPMVWILVQGILMWGFALFLLGGFSLTPFCIGQENGDGVNNLAECIQRATMSGLVCTPVYLGLLIANAFIGSWAMRFIEPRMARN